MNNNIRKLLFFLLICHWVLVCSACTDAKKFEYQPPNNYDLAQAHVSIICITGSDKQSVKDLGNNSPILEDLQNLPYYTYFNDPCIDLKGYAIVIRYDPNNYEIITHSASQTIIDGKTYYGRGYFETESFDALIEKYLGVAN